MSENDLVVAATSSPKLMQIEGKGQKHQWKPSPPSEKKKTKGPTHLKVRVGTTELGQPTSSNENSSPSSKLISQQTDLASSSKKNNINSPEALENDNSLVIVQ